MNSRQNQSRLNRIRWAAAARRASAGFLSFTLMGISGVTEIRGQDVATAARQEKARKDAQAKRAKRVYTEEDLARARILTAQDRAELEARQKRATAGGRIEAKAAPELEDDRTAPSVSLGEIARAYRAQKALAELEHTSDFHLLLENPILAAPMVPVRPPVKAKAPKIAGPRFSPPAMSSKIIARPNDPAVAPRLAGPRFSPPAVTSANIGGPAAPTVERKMGGARFAAPTFDSKPVAGLQPAVGPKIAGPRFVPPVVNSVTILPPTDPAVEPVEPMQPQDTVTVVRGDSLWKLARKNLGTPNRWRELLAVNPSIVDPSYIQQGAQIRLPMTSLEHGHSKVKVQKGDTLWGIARRMLARASFWSCIARDNPQITDANRIYTGQILNVPTDCGKTLR
jgi:nucleoid-associated protein YgaU